MSFKNFLAVFAIIIFSTQLSYAAKLKVVYCYKGFSEQEQKQNLSSCKAQLRDFQICSTNMFEHRNAAYDVCLMEATKEPKIIVALYKGFSQADQDRNLKSCKKFQTGGRICVSNAWIHKQAVYDVALMK